MFLVIPTPRKTVGRPRQNLGDIKERHYQCISGIRMGLQWKLRTLDKPFGYLSGVRFAVLFRNVLVSLFLVLDLVLDLVLV